jgi:uncharacterized protein (TIGR02246 family)
METPQKDTVDPQIIDQLNAFVEKYEEAVNNNDAAAMAALFTEDGVIVSDSGPSYGRQVIEKWYADTFQGWRPKNMGKIDLNSPRFIGAADNVAKNGEWSETVQGPTGEPIQIKGYWSAIDTREGDGWRSGC